MITKFNLVPRRKFLRQGIGVSALFFLVPREVVAFLTKPFNRNKHSGADSCADVLLAVTQRYGAEFGDIKPHGRKVTYGRV